MRTRRHRPAGHAAAMLALLLLSFASVRSVVMQAALSFQGDALPICGEGPPDPASWTPHAGPHGTVASPSRAGRPVAVHAHGTACPYCAAAVHPPIPGHGVLPPQAAGVVFAPYQVVASSGPRGPPAFEPRVRGPPADPLTA